MKNQKKKSGTAACAKRLRSAASNRCRAFQTTSLIPCANAPGNDLRVAQPADQLNSRFSLQQNHTPWFMHSTTRRTSHYMVRVVLCCSVLCCSVLCCSMLSSAALQALCCALCGAVLCYGLCCALCRDVSTNCKNVTVKTYI